MFQIAQLLEIPGQSSESNQLLYSANPGIRTGSSRIREHRPLFSTSNRIPGFAAALRRENTPSGSLTRVQAIGNKSFDK